MFWKWVVMFVCGVVRGVCVCVCLKVGGCGLMCVGGCVGVGVCVGMYFGIFMFSWACCEYASHSLLTLCYKF